MSGARKKPDIDFTTGHIADPPRCAICGGPVVPSLAHWWIDAPAHARCVDDRRHHLVGTDDDDERDEYYRAAMADAHRAVDESRRQKWSSARDSHGATVRHRSTGHDTEQEHLMSIDIPGLETLIRDSGATRDQWRTALRHVFPPVAEDPDHRWDGSRIVRWATDEISAKPSTSAEAAHDVWRAFFGRGTAQPVDEEGCVFTVTGPDGAISYIDLSDPRYTHLFDTK